MRRTNNHVVRPGCAVLCCEVCSGLVVLCCAGKVKLVSGGKNVAFFAAQ